MKKFKAKKNIMFETIAQMNRDSVSACMHDSEVLSNILQLEKHEKDIYQFYSQVGNNDPFSAFRSGSVCKWF